MCNFVIRNSAYANSATPWSAVKQELFFEKNIGFVTVAHFSGHAKVTSVRGESRGKRGYSHNFKLDFEVSFGGTD